MFHSLAPESERLQVAAVLIVEYLYRAKSLVSKGDIYWYVVRNFMSEFVLRLPELNSQVIL